MSEAGAVRLLEICWREDLGERRFHAERGQQL